MLGSQGDVSAGVFGFVSSHLFQFLCLSELAAEIWGTGHPQLPLGESSIGFALCMDQRCLEAVSGPGIKEVVQAAAACF